MMEEYFMRGWTHGHERLSADLDRGFAWLRGKAGQFVEAVTPSHASGADVYFLPRLPDRPAAIRPVRVRAAKPR